MTTGYQLDDFTDRRILVVGDVMLDRYLWGDVERVSPEAPVPVCLVKRMSETPGGAGNVVSNLVGLGAGVCLVGLRGEDSSGERLCQLLHQRKVDTHILTDPSRPTITKTRIVSTGQQLLRLDEEEIAVVPRELQEAMLDRIKENLPTCQAIILSDYGKGVLREKSVCQSIIHLAKVHDVRVFVDPKGKDWERYKGATCITPNMKELEQVYGEPISDERTLILAMRTLMERYDLEWLVVTRGPRGMCIMARNADPVSVPALAREVYDVSGAGDTVIATLALSTACGYSLAESAKVANLAGGIVVGKVGTQAINLLELKLSLQTTGVDGATSSVTRKLATLRAAAVQVEAWKATGEATVFTSGSFDILHPGHLHLLHQAKDLGGRVIVGLNGDALVRRRKGPNRPIVGERDRACLLVSLECVDMVVILDEESEKHLIATLKPDVVVKGGEHTQDDTAGNAIVKGYGGAVKVIPLLEGYSTTRFRALVIQDGTETCV